MAALTDVTCMECGSSNQKLIQADANGEAYECLDCGHGWASRIIAQSPPREDNLIELFEATSKPWYRYGHRSLGILYARLRHRYRPIFRTQMMWQRARHGLSDEDGWSLDQYLAQVIVAGTRKLQKWNHGYPAELSGSEEWLAILKQIEDGFQAFLDDDIYDGAGREKYDAGLALFSKWFGALWD